MTKPIKQTKQEKKEYKKWLNETIVSGIICNDCGKTLPDILAKHHMDINCPTNQCPHPPTHFQTKSYNIWICN
jgi:hypothetical protein